MAVSGDRYAACHIIEQIRGGCGGKGKVGSRLSGVSSRSPALPQLVQQLRREERASVAKTWGMERRSNRF